jgi:hypothetical protein
MVSYVWKSIKKVEIKLTKRLIQQAQTKPIVSEVKNDQPATLMKYKTF